MPGPKAPEVTLSEEARKGLEKIVHKHSTTQEKAKRAIIILLAGRGKGHAEIACEMGISKDAAMKWRRRWLGVQHIPLEGLSIEERLEDLPRPGTPPRIKADQICRIEQMACEKPSESGRPISQWTGREIADEIMKRGIVEHISARHASRLIKRGVSSHT